jgi:hypothetical protein
MSFGIAQTGQLDKANADRAATIEIVEKCEARDAAAREATSKKAMLPLSGAARAPLKPL